MASDSVLLVSTSEKSSQALVQLLKEQQLSEISLVQSGAVARLRLLNKRFELVIINMPLGDESGLELAELAVENQSAVILLVKNEHLDAVFSRLNNTNIHLVAKPLYRSVFFQAIRQIQHQRETIRSLTDENFQLQQKIKDANLNNRAKLVLIDVLKMSEPQAHRYIEKQAMDTRQSKVEVAAGILNTYEN